MTMHSEECLGPFCQRCGLPLVRPEDFGTSHAGHRVNEFCARCYRDGEFTTPGPTIEGVLDRYPSAFELAPACGCGDPDAGGTGKGPLG